MNTEVMKQEEQTRAMRARLPISTDGSQNMRQVISDTSQSHSCTWPSCNPDEPGPVGEVVSYGSHLHPEWFSGRVPLLGTLLYTAPPAQAKEIEGLKAATHVRIPADEYEALRQLQFYTRIPGQENMVLRFLKEIEDCDHRKNAAIAQQTKETE